MDIKHASRATEKPTRFYATQPDVFAIALDSLTYDEMTECLDAAHSIHAYLTTRPALRNGLECKTDQRVAIKPLDFGC